MVTCMFAFSSIDQETIVKRRYLKSSLLKGVDSSIQFRQCYMTADSRHQDIKRGNKKMNTIDLILPWSIPVQISDALKG